MVVCGAAHQNQRLVPLPQLQEEVVNVQKNERFQLQTNKQDVGVEEEVSDCLTVGRKANRNILQIKAEEQPRHIAVNT